MTNLHPSSGNAAGLSDHELSLLPGEPLEWFLLRESPAHRVLRVRCAAGSFVLKSFLSPALEVQVYALLDRLGVPTLPRLAQSDRALLLEDLESSQTWRLAAAEDTNRADVGEALAAWYLRLHQAGRLYLSQKRAGPALLTAWVETVELSQLTAAGEKFGLEGAPGWSYILDHLEPLKSAYWALPQTFNYNDFSWVNLALSRTGASLRACAPLRAVVFDYDCFSLGAAYSDCRNVMYSLSGPALDAFADTYGPLDPLEQVLDDPLSALEGLVVASTRERMPGWAKPLVEDAQRGKLERQVRRALESAPA